MAKASVVLLSGGLDSAANLAFAVERDRVVLALTADYGQKAATQELRAAADLARHYSVPHQVVDLRWLGRLGGSSLTEQGQTVPELDSSQLDRLEITRKSASAVWVPNRNGVLINAAAAYAERLAAERVVVGFNREEAATFPDNSEDFLRKATAALALSTANQIEVFSYTLSWDKREIVAQVRHLAKEFPFEKLWSCYLSGEKPCGQCESCQRLKRALGKDRYDG